MSRLRKNWSKICHQTKLTLCFFPTPGAVLLGGGNTNCEGPVEIFLNAEWGTTDEDPWDNDDAEVESRQLGYPYGGVVYRGAHFGEGSGSIWLELIVSEARRIC